MMHWTRETFGKVFRRRPEDLGGMELIYDVAHNIAKIEDHVVDGKNIRVCVHRKGATRAFLRAILIFLKHTVILANRYWFRETWAQVLIFL